MAAARISIRAIPEDADEWRAAAPAEWVDTCKACGVSLTRSDQNSSTAWTWRAPCGCAGQTTFDSIELAAYDAIDTLNLMQ